MIFTKSSSSSSSSKRLNFIKVTVIGKRKHEIGLVVPAQYDCYTKIKRISAVLDKDKETEGKVFDIWSFFTKTKITTASFLYSTLAISGTSTGNRICVPLSECPQLSESPGKWDKRKKEENVPLNERFYEFRIEGDTICTIK